MLALLIALVSIGSPPCQQGPHEWQIEYADGVVESPPATESGELTFEPRPYLDWRSRTKPQGAAEWGPWSGWVEVEHYPGDLDGDCVVNNKDWQQFTMHFGDQCP